MAEADEKLRNAMESQKALFPKEYATPVHPTEGGGAQIVASHSLIPDALYHAFATFGVLMSPRSGYAAVVSQPRWFGALAVVVFFFLPVPVVVVVFFVVNR